jgi:hypothetical protein
MFTMVLYEKELEIRRANVRARIGVDIRRDKVLLLFDAAMWRGTVHTVVDIGADVGLLTRLLTSMTQLKR